MILLAFLDKNHKHRIATLNDIWNHLYKLEKMAHKENIPDAFQDNGGKVLQQAIISDIHFLPGREGNDAVDRNGVQWEFKSININTSARGFSTEHTLTFKDINRYKKIPWLFSVYRGISLKEMYVLSPGQLNTWIKKQEKHLKHMMKLPGNKRRNHLNNPKIPLKFVEANGTKIYPFPQPAIDPASLDK